MEKGVRISLEPKASVLFEKPELWEKLGREYDAAGHPRFFMTLSDIGHPVKRAEAAKAVSKPWAAALLPRGPRPPDTTGAWQVFDAIWGDAWGKDFLRRNEK